MTTITKKQKLFDFIRDANEDELDSLYAIVRSKSNYSKSILEDDLLLAEINERAKDLKSGNVKGISWEEVKGRVRK
jgi:hypothetical protein